MPKSFKDFFGKKGPNEPPDFITTTKDIEKTVVVHQDGSLLTINNQSYSNLKNLARDLKDKEETKTIDLKNFLIKNKFAVVLVSPNNSVEIFTNPKETTDKQMEQIGKIFDHYGKKNMDIGFGDIKTLK